MRVVEEVRQRLHSPDERPDDDFRWHTYLVSECWNVLLKLITSGSFLGFVARPSVTRRELLAGLACGGIGSLAGCGCHPPGSDFRLRVDVTDIEASGDQFVGQVELWTPTHPDWNTEESEFKASYENVVFFGYDADGEEVVRADIGDFEPGTTKRQQFRSSGFPLIVTANAEDATTASSKCAFIETGAQVRGYLGYFDPSESSNKRTGHVWKTLHRRRLGDPLPPADRVFDRLKCKHRAAVQPHPDRPLTDAPDRGPKPDLSLVPDADSWADRRIPFPTVREKYEFGAGRRANEEEMRQHEKWDVTVPFERCPPTVREAIRDQKPIGWTSESEFFDGVSQLEGERITGPGQLPACEEENVSCGDTRRVECSEGPQFTGRYFRVLHYFTEFEDEVYPVSASYQKHWLPPDAPDELPPCTDNRSEKFKVGCMRDVKVRDETEALAVPEWLRHRVRDYDGIGNTFGFSTSPDKWKQAIATLQGRTESQMPMCQWSNVHCFADPLVHCGKGYREAIYWAKIDGDRWNITLTYKWRNLPKETTDE